MEIQSQYVIVIGKRIHTYNIRWHRILPNLCGRWAKVGVFRKRNTALPWLENVEIPLSLSDDSLLKFLID